MYQYIAFWAAWSASLPTHPASPLALPWPASAQFQQISRKLQDWKRLQRPCFNTGKGLRGVLKPIHISIVPLIAQHHSRPGQRFCEVEAIPQRTLQHSRILELSTTCSKLSLLICGLPDILLHVFNHVLGVLFCITEAKSWDLVLRGNWEPVWNHRFDLFEGVRARCQVWTWGKGRSSTVLRT